MISKTSLPDIQPYLKDASNMPGGHATAVFIPENENEVALFLKEAYEKKMPVTIAGNGTGLAGGRVPLGGWVLSLEKLTHLKFNQSTATVGAGLRLKDFLDQVTQSKFYYPPDPTSWPSCIAGNVACNASGPRTFKYGPTRDFVQRLKIVLADGRLINLERGKYFSNSDGVIEIPMNGTSLKIQIPSYGMPNVKNTAGYYVKNKMDAIDLFIGSEGTLGVITEVELTVLLQPRKILSFAVFFPSEEKAWEFADAGRIATRRNGAARNDAAVQASAIEYLDGSSLDMVREKFPEIPANARACIMIEQECQSETEILLMDQWGALIEKYHGEYLDAWFADDADAQSRLKQFRHAVPMAVKEFLIKHGQPKVGTDTAVPHENFKTLMLYHRKRLEELKLPNLTFGHIGDSHVHLNILPKNQEEHQRAWALYAELVEKAIQLGGTPAGEHGIGKMKHAYLRAMLGPKAIAEMVALKKTLDPAGLLGRGNIFPEEFL